MKWFESPSFSNKNICIAGIFIQMLAAFFSVGYHNPDEHWQLLEFAAYKLGFAPVSDMPWEVAAKSRQAILPFIVYVLAKIMLFFNVYNPFNLALILRLISGILAYGSMMLLIFRFKNDFKSENIFKIVVLLANFLWFIPYIHTRFQSENWTGIFLTLGLYFLYPTLKNEKQHFSKLFLIGFLFGIAFIIRIQTGLALFGLVIWILLFCRFNYFSYLIIVAGFITMCLLGTCIDYWFYGVCVFTPYTYFDLQVLQSLSSNWGVFPWWYYVYLFIIQAVPIESIFLLLLFSYSIFSNPKHVLTWIVLFFLVGHSYISYKEIRYLYPLIPLFLILCGLGMSQRYFNGFIMKINTKTFSIILYLVLIQNSILLLVTTLKPANEIVNVQKFLYEKSQIKPIKVYINGKESPFQHGNMKYNFYGSKNITIIYVETANNIPNNTQNEYSFFAEKSIIRSENFNSDKVGNVVFQSIPAWLTNFNYTNWLSRARVWSVYEINN